MPVKGPELQKLKQDIEDHLNNKNIAPPTPEVRKYMEDIMAAI